MKGFSMWLFSSLKRNKKLINELNNNTINPHCILLNELDEFMKNISNKDEYISRSMYINRLKDYEQTINYYKVLANSDTLEEFCKKNNLDYTHSIKLIQNYDNFINIIDKHNEEYIKRHLKNESNYLDNILKDVDSNIKLDEEQRRVILTDEDYCLVVAGAGAGKTTTIAAKVKYLVEKKQINPSQILVISFTNKAVKELRDKINNDLNIQCPIATFHSTGHALLRKENPEGLNIFDSDKKYFVIRDYFKKSVLKNESLVNNLILFFSSYFDAPYDGINLNDFFDKIDKSNYTTLKSDLNEFEKQIIDKRTKKMVTIQNEQLRSKEEVEIANYLYINSIDYNYEPVYKYNIGDARKPYTPDFIIKQGNNVAYLEHFGISQDGNNYRYTKEELEIYKRSINDKIMLHRKHDTKLIYTFSKYNDKRPLIIHLKEELEKNGFVLNKRNYSEIIEKLVITEESKYIKKLLALICRFITNFKTNGYNIDDFRRMYSSTSNVRTKLFLTICHDCYLEYQKYLKENNAVDFEDMINESARLLENACRIKENIDFKYIIVDEYQDISRQRFDLVKAISKTTNAKIIAVGDDWQSIYAFSGSDISLFTKFEEKMGYAKLLKIVNTYRNSQEIIDIAGNFIQKNTHQITKQLISPKRINNPIIIHTYDSKAKSTEKDYKSGVNYAIASTVEKILEEIIEYNKLEGKTDNSSILILGRFNFDGDRLEKSGLFEFINKQNRIKSVKYPKLNITIMTAHASKGLGFDNVIVINGKNGTYGFPSKIEDDPVLSFVVKQDKTIAYAEERRLFYVAMTRTKNRVFFIAPEANPSEFLLEIKRDYKNVVLKGEWNENLKDDKLTKKRCPRCGYPLQYRYKEPYGLPLFICTNEPELCGFITNRYDAGALSILKCDKCQDGYLVVKQSEDKNFLLGCTNYKKNGKGCNNTLSKKQYYELINNTNKENNQKLTIEIIDEPSNMNTINENYVNIEKATVSLIWNGIDLNDVLYTILNAVEHISEKHFYSSTILASVLHGDINDLINKRELYNISEFGKIKDLDEILIKKIIYWLVDKHYLLESRARIDVIHATFEGRNYKDTITLKDLTMLRSILDDTLNELNKNKDNREGE